jgi:hypothetical protein
MSDEEKSKSWWQTLPGVITGLAAVITALAGLVVAIRQAGWIGPPTPTNSAQAPLQPTRQSPGEPSPASSSPPQASPVAAPSPTRSVALPEMRDYKLGMATFTLLSAEVSPQTSEKDALRIQLRMMNHDTYDANFWSNSFRLIVDGVPRAPDSNLNELVAGRSAKEGAVMFEVPRGTPSVSLEITYGEEHTQIPLALAAPR